MKYSLNIQKLFATVSDEISLDKNNKPLVRIDKLVASSRVIGSVSSSLVTPQTSTMSDDFDGRLTPGAVSAIYHNEDHGMSSPIVQVLSCKRVASNNPNAPERWRLILSDGVYFAQAMAASSHNPILAQDPPLVDKNSIIRLITFSCNLVQGRRIIISLGMESVCQWHEKIGSPVSIEAEGASTTAAAGTDVKPDVANNAGRGGSNASSTSAAVKKGSVKPAGNGRSGGAPIYPIEGLSPYQNKWTIKARVTQKSDIRHWSNARGDGKLFSVNLLDESGEIRATGFNEAVDNLYNVLEEGKVFYISKARVNIAKKQFSNLSNEYEITFEKDTDVQLCEDQDAAPQIKFEPVEIGQLIEKDKDSMVDILGIVTDNGELGEIVTKQTNRQLKKRELTVVDRSGYSVRLTLWGKQAENWQEVENGLYVFKGAKVNDYGGRSLSMSGGSTIQADPDVEMAHELRGWFDTEGHTSTFQSFNSGMAGGGATTTSFNKDLFKTLDEVVKSGTGLEEVSYFSTRATISFIKTDNLSYPACPTDKCNKKVVMQDDASWRCERCEKVYQEPEYRYILSLTASDFTGQLWLSGFNDLGVQLLGKTANEMHALKENDSATHDAVLHGAIGQTYNFNIRAKADNYRDETRVRYHIQKAAPVNFVEAAKDMLKALGEI
ncbi:Replication factor A protein 1 [Microbotryomycetes sp. JL221]|nr:Replication factor A protein 1 [Microbotryomycetes sp. JL221]